MSAAWAPLSFSALFLQTFSFLEKFSTRSAVCLFTLLPGFLLETQLFLRIEVRAAGRSTAPRHTSSLTLLLQGLVLCVTRDTGPALPPTQRPSRFT